MISALEIPSDKAPTVTPREFASPTADPIDCTTAFPLTWITAPLEIVAETVGNIWDFPRLSPAANKPPAKAVESAFELSDPVAVTVMLPT